MGKGISAVTILAALAAGCGRGVELVEEGPGPAPRPEAVSGKPREFPALERALRKPVSANFIKVRFDSFLRLLLESEGIRYRTEGDVPTDYPGVLLQVEKMPRGAALRWACRQVGCCYRIEGEEVVLSAGDGGRMPAPAQDEEAKAYLAEAQRALEQKVSMNFVGVDLAYVLSTLFKISGVNFVLDRDAVPSWLVTVSFNDIPLREALRMICDQAGLEFAPVDYAMFVGPREAISQVTDRAP